MRRKKWIRSTYWLLSRSSAEGFILFPDGRWCPHRTSASFRAPSPSIDLLPLAFHISSHTCSAMRFSDLGPPYKFVFLYHWLWPSRWPSLVRIWINMLRTSQDVSRRGTARSNALEGIRMQTRLSRWRAKPRPRYPRASAIELRICPSPVGLLILPLFLGGSATYIGTGCSSSSLPPLCVV
jgi:hypothetical protein